MNNDIKPFKFWCQWAIPAIYDDSLSYYELLCKVVASLNETITATNTTANAITELQNYVAHYFDNLNVQNEINTKLDELVKTGELSELIMNYVPSNLNYEKLYQNSEIICVGDSIMYGRAVSDISKLSIPARLATKLQATAYNYAVNSGAFTRTGNLSILNRLQQAIDNPQINKSNVKLVLIEGGINDSNDNVNYDTLYRAVISVIRLAQQNYPNARIITLPMMMGILPMSFFPNNNRESCHLAICNASAACGIECINNVYSWGIGQLDWFSLDITHPNDDGTFWYSNYILEFLAGSKHEVNFAPVALTTSAIAPDQYFHAGIKCVNGIIELAGIWRTLVDTEAGINLFRLPAWACSYQFDTPINAWTVQNGTRTPLLLTLKCGETDIKNKQSEVTLKLPSTLALSSGTPIWIPPVTWRLGA